MKTVQLQKHVSSNFSANLISVQIYLHSKSLCRRRDEGFRSADEDESENRGFRDLKKYTYIDSLYYKRCKEEKNKDKVASVLFAFLYCLLQWK